ncbi:phytoene desaturase family protein [Falsibacillus albus]|uniref:4,4'-diaponeurosporene oxygenase n=1 Tax=Falsibacillus albus TaxID=2478915 RepID=A0A3L7JX80_9BACI|nr:phytoene desaturase family protein [Falsibacillus albus]RLQ95498.1 phytoene desaturase [Falsibacillus albus]
MKKKVVIVGGGLAGMSAAIRLAAEHYDVTILEKGERLGGKLNIREGNGYTFDTGPSILTMPWVLEKLFEHVDRDLHDYVEIMKIEPGWRTFFEDGTVLDLTSELPKMLNELKKVSDDDKNQFFDYLSYCQRMYDLSMKSFYKKSISGLNDLRMMHPVKELLQMDPMKTMSQSTKKYFKSKHLQQLFNFLVMYIGSSPYHAPAILSQLTHVQLGIGVYYVKGGMYKIAEAMEKVLKELGVKIRVCSEVEKIQTDGTQAKGVKLKTGEQIEADIVVSNLEAIPCYESLLEEYDYSSMAVKDLEKFQPTVSGLVLLLGVNKTYPHLSHHNFFFSGDPEKEFKQIFDEKKLADDPTVYIGISSKSDASQAPAGKENLFVLTHVPPLKKGEDWCRYREKYEKIIMEKLERMGMEGLQDHIEYKYTFTPNDIQSLYGSNGGSIYGAITDRKLNGGFKIPNKSHVLKNVYFVGGSTHPGGGVPMVSLSGQLTAELIMKEEQKDKRQIG